MNKNLIVSRTRAFVKKELGGESTGHDYWHLLRVERNAARIARGEGGDLLVIRLAALLHDIADWKFHGGDEKASSRRIRAWFKKLKVSDKITNQVCDIADTISLEGAGVKNKMKSKEGKIVQDADRLDALGAIGIARCFAYGGAKNREIYNPEIKPVRHASFSHYKKSQSTSLNHFYEKLLLLQSRMNTKTGKRLAKRRHQFVTYFLRNFLDEWNGKT